MEHCYSVTFSDNKSLFRKNIIVARCIAITAMPIHKYYARCYPVKDTRYDITTDRAPRVLRKNRYRGKICTLA